MGRAPLAKAEGARLPARPPVPPGPYIVAGLGRAGRSAVDALSRFAGADLVVAWDREATRRTRRLARELEAVGIRTYLGRDPPAFGGRHPARTLVKSPGISSRTRLFREASECGVEVLDELELGWRLSRTPMLAVTGTNGKSTVAGLAAALLTASGRSVQLAGNTDFGPPLSAVAAEPLDWTVCEVSSFQLEGCPALLPDIAVFTNLTHEHLHRHTTMRRYGQAKRRLFVRGETAVPLAVIDVDDPFGRALAKDVERRGGAVVRVGFAPDADYRLMGAAWDLRRGQVSVHTPSGELELTTRLPGFYNARNVAAALAIADVLGVERSIAAPTLATQTGPPGRFEHLDEGQDFDAIVDFAHTPDGVEQFLATVRAGMSPGGRLTTVLGLGGRSTTRKQRDMGRVARALSDDLILTTSGYQGEPPIRALQGILQGARTAAGGRLEVVLDRRRAIEQALRAAVPPDVVVVPGRGAFTEMNVDRGRPRPFDDREVAREVLRDL